MSADASAPVVSGRLKAHEVIADKIRTQILSGDLKVGDRLPPEAELRASFGVARGPMREALRLLEAEGLVRVRRGRGGGPVVTQPDLEPTGKALATSLHLQGATLGDLYAAMRVIETTIAADLAREHTPADLKRLEAAIDEAALAAGLGDANALGRAATRLHETLVECSQSTTLTTISRLIHGLVQNYYELGSAGTSHEEMSRAVRSYRRLLTLIESGNPEAARAHWEEHMRVTIGMIQSDTLLRVHG